MEKVDVVIVGGGLAGLSCAYGLAQDGFSVIVLERGDAPGAKNVTGGRLYLNPIKDIYPELWTEAPFERRVTKEILTLTTDTASSSFELHSQRFNQPPYHSYTVLRSQFDKWLADKATAKGAFVIPNKRVDELIKKDGKIIGVKIGAEEIGADVVVAADGALSFIAQKAGLGQKLNPQNYALGIKEIIKLSPEIIEERFNLAQDEGAARLFAGSLTKGMAGGGFLYTNKDTLSLGMVLGLKSFIETTKNKQLNLPDGQAGQLNQCTEIYKLLDEFKARPELKPLLKDGETIEYSAHLIPEAGLNMVPKLYGDGILVVGDAAGFSLNMLVTVRGMDLAIISGYLAAQTIKQAKQKNDYSHNTLAHYQKLLDNSAIITNLKTFQGVTSVLANPRFFSTHPQMICELFEKVMWIDDKDKPKLSSTVLKGLSKNLLGLQGLKDLMDLRRI